MTAMPADTREAQVVVRMYRSLLGDCFLIRIGSAAGRSSILVDCGVLQGTPNADARMTAIAADIREACGGRLDLVVATHEHADHLSGFGLARELFLDPGGITIGEVWMAWTENPADTQATALRARFTRGQAVVQKLALAMATALPGSAFAAAPNATRGLEAFLGAAPGLPRLTTRTILEALKTVARRQDGSPQPPRFLEPGDRVTTPGVSPLSAFVLGPPRDPKLLFKDLPGKAETGETYLSPLDWNLGLLEAVADGQDDPPADPANTPATHSPFGWADQQITANKVAAEPKSSAPVSGGGADAATRRWLREHYYDVSPGRDDQARRRIDGDWLASAGQFALKLDSDTNNTSLVLAFELPDGSFMLFAADAQVGNWESWASQTYADGDTTLGIANILGRVRLYKVGHHGSHNATLQTGGLELMTRSDLVAMVSTDEEFAKGGGKNWLMPNPRVKQALLDKTRGRLIRGDKLWHGNADAATYPPSPDFVARLDEGSPLYVDYTVYGIPPAPGE